MPLFPSVPEDLEAADADALQGLLDEFKTIGARVQADLALPKEERELISEMSATEVTEALAEAAETKVRIDEHLKGIAAAEETFTNTVNEQLSALGVETEPAEALAAEEEPAPDPEELAPDDEPDETAAAVEVEELAVAEVEVEPVVEEEPAEEPTPRMSIPRGPSRYTPKAPVAAGNGATVVTTGGLGSIKVNEGQHVNRLEFADLAVKLAKKLRPPQHVKGGTRDFFPIAGVSYTFPPEFTLGASWDDNLEKIRAVASPLLGEPTDLEVFQASGGICAPPTPFYDVPGFASRERPVRNALPSYNATRGGVSIPSVNIVDRDDAGVTVIEESEDAQGGTFATKACRDIECASWTETFIGIISHCLEVGTLNNRTWPEGVALEVDNLMAGHAATAETRLLNRIKSLSVRSAATSPYNATHGLIYALVRARAAVRSVLRAPEGARYTALVPEWMQELLVADLAAQSGNDDRYVAMSAVDAYVERLGISVAWYKDTPTTGTSQLIAAEDQDGTLNVFPLEAQIALFLNGTFIHLDGGSLELGLVRDSELNHLNNHELFGEDFENVARVGPEQAARWITLDTCPNGTFPALATAISC